MVKIVEVSAAFGPGPQEKYVFSQDMFSHAKFHAPFLEKLNSRRRSKRLANGRDITNEAIM